MVTTTVHERYAVLAGLRLALATPRTLVRASDVAEFGGMPLKVTEQILNALTKAGIATSKRGRSGGYTLARHPERLTVLELMEAVGGGEVQTQSSNSAGHELLTPLLQEANRAALAVLSGTTLADLTARGHRLPMYYI